MAPSDMRNIDCTAPSFNSIFNLHLNFHLILNLNFYLNFNINLIQFHFILIQIFNWIFYACIGPEKLLLRFF